MRDTSSFPGSFRSIARECRECNNQRTSETLEESDTVFDSLWQTFLKQLCIKSYTSHQNANQSLSGAVLLNSTTVNISMSCENSTYGHFTRLLHSIRRCRSRRVTLVNTEYGTRGAKYDFNSTCCLQFLSLY